LRVCGAVWLAKKAIQPRKDKRVKFEIEITAPSEFTEQYEQLRQDIARHFGLADKAFRIKSGSCLMFVLIDGNWVRYSHPTLAEMKARLKSSPIKLEFNA
jgi:hypothetical protein